MPTRRCPRLFALAVPVLAALLFASCSSSSTSSTTTTSSAGSVSSTTSGTPSSTTEASSTTTVPETCPSAAVVTAALGTAYPAPKSSSGAGSVLCNYSDPTTSADLVIGFSKVAGLSPDELKLSADSQAVAQKVSAKAVPGFGDAAYLFTLNDASTNASGIATTIMLIEVGSTLVDITAQATPAHTEALAHDILK